MNILKVVLEEMLVTQSIENTQSSISSFQQTFNESVGIINFILYTTTHLMYSIIQFVVAVILLVFLFRLIMWMSREDERIIVFPFEIQTYTKTYNGKVISDSLVLEVYRIDKIHNTEYVDINSEKINLPKVTPNREILDTKISSLEGFSIGDISIPVGELAIVLKQLWPIGGPGKRIIGSLQEYESEMRLTAQMEGRETFTWDTKTEKTQTDDEDETVSRIEDLAFMIVFDLSKQELEAKTWTSLKYFTKTLEAYSRYTKTQQLKDLKVASKNCIKAKKADSDYQLLCSTFYNFGIAYFDLENYKCSKEMFEHSIDLNKKDENAFIGLGASLSCLEQYNDALEAFDRALEINPNNLDALVQKGKILFLWGNYEDALDIYNKVLKADPNDKDALYDRACVYCREGKETDALKDLKHAIEINSEWKKFAKDDEDLKQLWDNESFKQLVNKD